MEYLFQLEVSVKTLIVKVTHQVWERESRLQVTALLQVSLHMKCLIAILYDRYSRYT